jgi:hypothetical protein
VVAVVVLVALVAGGGSDGEDASYLAGSLESALQDDLASQAFGDVIQVQRGEGACEEANDGWDCTLSYTYGVTSEEVAYNVDTSADGCWTAYKLSDPNGSAPDRLEGC